MDEGLRGLEVEEINGGKGNICNTFFLSGFLPPFFLKNIFLLLIVL